MTTALTPRVDLMDDDTFTRHLEHLDALEDADRLCERALAKERRIYGLWELEGGELRKAVADRWCGR
jgi:hypothetical protein